MANQYYQEFAKRYIEAGGTIGISHIENLVTENYFMKQNYPNPFNPTTSIKYDLPSKGIVTVKVYDVLGNEVEILVKEFQNSGTYEVTWNAQGRPSGIYLCVIESNGRKDSMKMMIVK